MSQRDSSCAACREEDDFRPLNTRCSAMVRTRPGACAEHGQKRAPRNSASLCLQSRASSVGRRCRRPFHMVERDAALLDARSCTVDTLCLVELPMWPGGVTNAEAEEESEAAEHPNLWGASKRIGCKKVRCLCYDNDSLPVADADSAMMHHCLQSTEKGLDADPTRKRVRAPHGCLSH
jgi:hypothetical protein